MTVRRATSQRGGLIARFFAPRSLDELAQTCADLEARADDDAADFTLLALPSPRPHPAALALAARAASSTPSALAAVLDAQAYVDDGGALALWPWYAEEEASERPKAEAAAKATGLALPPEHLDAPYDPSFYLRRAGWPALAIWLKNQGLDADACVVAKVPAPKASRLRRFEGGLRADDLPRQAQRELEYSLRLLGYADSPESLAHFEARLRRAFDRYCEVSAGRPPTSPPREPYEALLGGYDGPPRPARPIEGLHALDEGALLEAGGRLLRVRLEGSEPTVDVFPRVGPIVFAGGRAAFFEWAFDGVAEPAPRLFDFDAGRFVEGRLEDALARLGVDDLPSTSGHDERTTPVVSACGRYLLDLDESPYIVRLRDGVIVAEGSDLDAALSPGRGRALLCAADVPAGEATMLGGYRFTLRAGEPPVLAPSRPPIAFALAGRTFRFFAGGALREGRRVLARLGVPILHAAFRADGERFYALGEDHLVEVAFDGGARVQRIAAVEPWLRAGGPR